MINLGIYTPSVADETFSQAMKEIKRCKDSGLIRDASIFYDTMAPITVPIECGLFNSTDIWNFSGKLFAVSVDAAVFAAKTVNNIDIYFGYGWGTKNVFATLNLVHKHKVKTICKSESLSADFYRITGTQPLGHTEDLSGLYELMTGTTNE